jgi:hypothetical protein
MPIPSQAFNTIQDLLVYINTYFIPNGNQDIDGDEGNNILNGLANFIVSYTLNSGLVRIESGGGVIILSKPMTVFTGGPTSIQWPGNIQNEYYITNATGLNISLTNGYSYIDQFATAQTIIPARTSIHIAKATNGSWIQMNNLPGSSGGSLPPQTGHEGEFLYTNGVSAAWLSPSLSITSANFTSATECPLPDLEFSKFSLYYSDLANFIYEDINQWMYLTGGGFEVLIPGFDANANNVHFELFIKGLNS